MFYKKILSVVIVTINAVFVLSLIAGITSLVLPQVYYGFTESKIEGTELANNLHSVDSTLTQISRVQISITNTINGIFNTDQQQEVQEYQSNLYQQVINLFSNLIRISILLISTILLLFTLYVRYSFSAVFQLNTLQKQIDELKNEISTLKGIKTH
ncbi:MAG: hypothetical protein IAE91_01450 [Ignavibacteriaceae bacterium]|nr:hypothetical protein [Ignavibacteriaceae bacterium]